jgi:hypothetical protein
MVNRNNPSVFIRVSKNYFEKVFEPERIKLQNIKGIKLTQIGFTEFLVRSGSKIKYPKNALKLNVKSPRTSSLRFGGLYEY